MALMRLNPNGALDTAFGSGGQVITPFQTSGNLGSESAKAVAVTSGGQILEIGAAEQVRLLGVEEGASQDRPVLVIAAGLFVCQNALRHGTPRQAGATGRGRRR